MTGVRLKVDLGELNDWRRLDHNLTGGGASHLVPIVISLKGSLNYRAGSVSVFQVGVGYRLFFRLFFSRRSVFSFGFYKNLGFGVGFDFFMQHVQFT
jgi:hypothetical protein